MDHFETVAGDQLGKDSTDHDCEAFGLVQTEDMSDNEIIHLLTLSTSLDKVKVSDHYLDKLKNRSVQFLWCSWIFEELRNDLGHLL